MYQDGQAETANSRSNLADQITMVKVIENELTNAKSELAALEKERRNKKRLVELTDYEYDRYKAHKNILKVIAYGALAVLFIVMLMTATMVSCYCWSWTYLCCYSCHISPNRR